MFVKILKMILYFFIIFAKPVYAEDFTVTHDSVDNKYLQTIAFTTQGYPQIENITYANSDFTAEDTNSLLHSQNVDAYMELSFPRRIYSVADKVYGPPGTQVDIDYIFSNAEDHPVYISKVYIPLSRNILANGDITKLLFVNDYTERNLSYTFSSLNLLRTGKYKEYSLERNFAPGEKGSFRLASFKIKNPINIDDIETKATGDGKVELKIYLQNNSDEYLNNLKLTYEENEEVFDLKALQEKLITFSLNTSESGGKIAISNPNVKEECTTMGSKYYTSTQSDAVPILAERDGVIIPGLSVQPAQESFCIKRTPYTMYSNVIDFKEVDAATKTTEEDNSGEVLGIEDSIKTLPKTGKYPWGLTALLVVDVVLWYSFIILRRNYESKNINTRVCTKSSKNAR